MEKSTKIALGCGGVALLGLVLAEYYKKKKREESAKACTALADCAALAGAGATAYTLLRKNVPLLEDNGAGQTKIVKMKPIATNGSSDTFSVSSGQKVIVGITTSGSFWGRNIGEHAFIMCIDEYEPERSIMLDASGHYGKGRSSDVIDGAQINITIEDYLDYWNTDEKLFTFEFQLADSECEKIRKAIIDIEGRSWMSCASKASAVLSENYSDEIKKCSTPVGLLNTLNDFAQKHSDKVVVRYFDFKTNKEISDGKD